MRFWSAVNDPRESSPPGTGGVARSAGWSLTHMVPRLTTPAAASVYTSYDAKWRLKKRDSAATLSSGKSGRFTEKAFEIILLAESIAKW